MDLTSTARRSKHLLALLLWLSLVAWAAWQHASRADQPPVHDAYTYFLKAHNFWTNLTSAERINPLNVEPSFRPPGTVVMSYPFGFDTDYRGFYFRSVAMPIILLALSIVTAGYGTGDSARTKWYLALVAAFLCTLPAFYQFQASRDFPLVSYWGLVDNFLAGVAALATAAAIRSVVTRSLVWAAATGLLSGLCVLIKPSGVLVMALVGVTYLGLGLIRLRSQWPVREERQLTQRWLTRGLMTVAALDAIVLTASFASRYLSPKSLAYGNAAIQVMKTELQVTWPVMQSVIHMGLGYAFVAWLLVSVVLVLVYWRRVPAGPLPWSAAMATGLAVASCVTFVFGVWFWIIGSGGATQIRYFMPFALMALTLAVPVLARVLPAMHPWAIVVLVLPMAFSVMHTGILLVQRNPSIEWQRSAGVNLSSGNAGAAAAQAREFAALLKREGRAASVYSMPMNVTDAEFQAAIDYARVADPPMPNVLIHRPVDWQRPSAFRVNEMLGSDYWVFEPTRDPQALLATLAATKVDDYANETPLFQAWATQLTRAEGVEIVSETATARVLRIIDRQRLDSAFTELLERRNWGPIFLAANTKKRWTERDVTRALANSRLVIENIQFGGRIDMRAMSVDRTNAEVTVRIWWKPMPELKERDWVFFVHSIDEQGNIRDAHHVALGAQDQALRDAGFRSDTVTFSQPSPAADDRLAIGFVRANEVLVADKGTRDWGGRRVIVRVP